MDESGIPATAPRRAQRRRAPWLMPGLPALVLAILTINVLVTGPTLRLTRAGRPGSGTPTGTSRRADRLR